MQIDSLLIAIATFFSVAQLTCVVTVSNCNRRLSTHFLCWYAITIVLMFSCTFYSLYSSEENPIVSEIINQAMSKSYMYMLFLLFVYMFNSYLSDKIESTKEKG